MNLYIISQFSFTDALYHKVEVERETPKMYFYKEETEYSSRINKNDCRVCKSLAEVKEKLINKTVIAIEQCENRLATQKDKLERIKNLEEKQND